MSYESYHQLPKAKLVSTIIGLQLALLLSALDQTIVTTAMPKIIANLSGFSLYAWVTTAYMLTSTASVPIFGRLSDIYGRKWFLVGGAVFFILASILCGFAGEVPFLLSGPSQGMSQLILFRGLQGIAGGIIMALVFTVVGDIFPPAERGKYQGLFSAVFALASVVGPTLGGWLTDCFNWRWVFFVNIPVGMLAVPALYFGFPHIPPHPSTRKVDYLGVFALISFLLPLLLGCNGVATLGWNSPVVLSCFGLAAVMLVLFIQAESRAKEPIVPLSLYTDSIVTLSSISLLLVGAGMFGAILFIPLFMQLVIGVSATKSGSLLTPMMLMMTLGSITSGQLVSRLGRYKVIALSGLGIMAVGMSLLAQLSLTTTEMQCVGGMMVVGLGLGLLMPVYTLVVQNVAPSRMIGAATAATQFFRSIGGTLGTAILGSLMLGSYFNYLSSNAPPGLKESLSVLKNPMHLIAGTSPQQHAVLMPAGAEGLVKSALVHALDGVFLLSAVLISTTFVLNLFLREVPLRKTHAAPSSAAINEAAPV